MSNYFLIFKKQGRYLAIVICTVIFCLASNLALANDWTFADSFDSQRHGDLNGQGGWAVTNYYGNSSNAVDIALADAENGEKYVEINNDDELVVSRDITPVSAGVFQFKMRHNKSGLFYFYALTSDEGGQLLFSIQFTESRGILLEEGNRQITLAQNYNTDQWYLFTIDFDNSRGGRGMFKIKIDDGDYQEYDYVDSSSRVFDFARMVFGSDSNGTAISAFGDIAPVSSVSTVTAPLNATDSPTITTVDIDGTSVVTTTPEPDVIPVPVPVSDVLVVIPEF